MRVTVPAPATPLPVTPTATIGVFAPSIASEDLLSANGQEERRRAQGVLCRVGAAVADAGFARRFLIDGDVWAIPKALTFWLKEVTLAADSTEAHVTIGPTPDRLVGNFNVIRTSVTVPGLRLIWERVAGTVRTYAVACDGVGRTEVVVPTLAAGDWVTMVHDPTRPAYQVYRGTTKVAEITTRLPTPGTGQGILWTYGLWSVPGAVDSVRLWLVGPTLGFYRPFS